MPASDRQPRRPDIEDIRSAAARIAGHAVVTPLLESPLLNDRIGGRLLVKAESLQRTGSFKFRGAFNAISQLDESGKQAGVVAFSSGNHAQGVAAAAAIAGIPALIVMPTDAPDMKIANTRALGAEVRLYDRRSDDREAIGDEIARRRGAVIIKPFENPDVIAGQGTVGLEIAVQTEALGVTPDAVVIPCGGGGLAAGTALALADRVPGAAPWIAEPAGFDDTARSLAAGRRLAADADASSICDALLSPMPGELTFAINSELLAGGLVVDDGQVREAMRAAFSYFKLVVEPGGATALAAALEGKLDCRGKTIVVVCSGGNVDPSAYAGILAGNPH